MKAYIIPNDCNSACWIGIEPEVSTKGQVLDILIKRYGSKNILIDNGRGEDWLINWNSNGTDLSHHGIVMGFQDKALRVWVFFSEGKLKVQDLINEIGNPHSVSTVISSIKEHEVICAGATLLYPQYGTAFELSSIPESVGVRSDQFIIGLEIIPPWNPEEHPWTDSAYTQWEGYHEYCPESWLQ